MEWLGRNNPRSFRSRHPEHPGYFRSDDAFEYAIDTGRLSTDSSAENYAGDYMYMGNENGNDLFKNINTRKYI